MNNVYSSGNMLWESIKCKILKSKETYSLLLTYVDICSISLYFLYPKLFAYPSKDSLAISRTSFKNTRKKETMKEKYPH